MKRRDLVGLYLLSVLVWSVLSVSGAVAAQEKGNLLLNGGFETPVSVEEWKLYGNSIPVVQNLVKYSGEYAVRLEKDGPKSLNGGLVSGSRNRIKIEPGCRYVFSLWIKCAPGADVSIRLAEYSPEGEWLQRYYAVGKSNAAEWRELKGDYMPTDPEVAAVAVDIRSDGGPVFIDDISLIQTEKAGQIPEGDNLISNPGFEEGGCATGWLLYQSVDGNSVPEAPAGAGRSAGRGLKVTPAGLGAKSSLNAIKPGRRYLLSLWIRTGGTGRVEARLSKFNSDKGWLKDRGILIGTNSTSKWQKVSCIFSPRSDEFFATVEIVSRGGVA
ncbi:MAG: carbohydrate binding domain-containing protein, partial [bacterium]